MKSNVGSVNAGTANRGNNTTTTTNAGTTTNTTTTSSTLTTTKAGTVGEQHVNTLGTTQVRPQR